MKARQDKWRHWCCGGGWCGPCLGLASSRRTKQQWTRPSEKRIWRCLPKPFSVGHMPGDWSNESKIRLPHIHKEDTVSDPKQPVNELLLQGLRFYSKDRSEEEKTLGLPASGVLVYILYFLRHVRISPNKDKEEIISGMRAIAAECPDDPALATEIKVVAHTIWSLSKVTPTIVGIETNLLGTRKRPAGFYFIEVIFILKNGWRWPLRRR